jgi:hypothetical protein
LTITGPAIPIGTCATPVKCSMLPGGAGASKEWWETCSWPAPFCSLRKARRASAASGVSSFSRQRRIFLRFDWAVSLLVIETVRRRSGRRRATPILYPRDGERFIVYAANAGAHRTPAWWLNLWGAGEGTAPFASVTPSRSQ